ncbi:MAG: hypothetical protein NC131_00750 [Roseburia sp.]|nr:hypothetical protein [Roseburia sp.]
MKKKVLLAAFAAACLVSGAAALAACSNSDNNGTHDHDYDTTKWVLVGNDKHAHPCKVEGCTSVSESATHTEKTVNTATCTEDGETITTCTVEGCPYEVKTPATKLGHEWDTEHPVQEQTHLQGVIYACKREGCNATSDEGEPLAHTYKYTYKDETTHTGKCDGADCGEVAEIEKPHTFKTESIGNFTVTSCEDCAMTELAEVKINLKKRISDSAAADYTGATLKVALYKIGEESDTPDYEATADSETGIATLKIAEGAYWVKVTDETNGYVTADANYIRYIKANAETDYSTREIILSEKAEYKVKLTYDGTTPATGVKVQVYPNYRYNGTITAPDLGEGVTDENGEVTFNLASSFDMVNADNCGLRVSNYNDTDYKPLSGLGIADSDKTKQFSFQHKERTFTIKVKAGDDYISGFTVKFYEKEYDPDTQTWSDKITATYVADGDSVVTEAMENVSKSFYIELPDSVKENWELPTLTVIDPVTKEERKEVAPFSTNTATGETVVELKSVAPTVKLVEFTIQLQIYKKGYIDYEYADTKITVKNAGNETVAEGTTNASGRFVANLPALDKPQYYIYMDDSTLPDSYMYVNGYQNFGVVQGDAQSQDVSVALIDCYKVQIAVCSTNTGEKVYHQGVTVKVVDEFVDLNFEGVTDGNGQVTFKIRPGAYPDTTLENLPTGFKFNGTSEDYYGGGEFELELQPIA